MYIVIPCYNEPALLTSLTSIVSCQLPKQPVKVLVIINEPEGASTEVSQRNKETFDEALAWANKHSSLQLSFEIQYHTLPQKHAGVGLARKIGMDIAAQEYIGLKNENGVIVCFDADSTVASNYLEAIEEHFDKHPESPAASIYFEHDLTTCETSDNYTGILNYELFLRYYIEGLKYAGYPYAFHTIGSSMAVRAGVYLKQGGMNKRKAGEDFYFLHKIIPLGGFTEINTTTVFPSSRVSSRVPFGTGKAMGDWMQNCEKVLYTYHPQVFEDLIVLMGSISSLDKSINYKDWEELQTQPVQLFLQQNGGEEGWGTAFENSANGDGFRKRWLRWWDGFRVLKLVHYLRDNRYPNIPVEDAAAQLLTKTKKAAGNTIALGLLIQYRAIQRD